MKIMIAGEVEKEYRRHLFPLLKPFQKAGKFSDEERRVLYHISEREVVFVQTMEEADFVVLPMSWNFYLQKERKSEMIKYVQKAKQWNKQVLSFMIGDYGIKIPVFDHVIVFRSSGHRSRLASLHKGIPSFISDPMQRIYHRTTVELQPYTAKPIIGFCGMANFSKGYAAEELARIFTRNISYRIGKNKNLPQELIPTTYRRAQLLKRCMDDDGIETNFLFRKKYFDGALTEEEKENSTREFYDNLRDSQYVLCFRGAGNFSVRLYETLAMGRIPVFVNTDCLIPLVDELEWCNHVIWIEYNERHKITNKIHEFHSKMNPQQFENLQIENRKLWEKNLTLGGFFRTQLKPQDSE